MADFAVKKVLSGEKPASEYRWANFLNGQTTVEEMVSMKRSVNASRK